jgi:hypothetical protein
MTDNTENEDIFSDAALSAQADTSSDWSVSDTDDDDELSLDLSIESFGTEYKKLPVGAVLKLEVHEAETRFSKSGNAMYSLVLKVVGETDTWGKNRQFYENIVLSDGSGSTRSTMFSTIPNLYAIGTPLRFASDGQELTSEKASRKLTVERKEAGISTKVLAPRPEAMVGRVVWARVAKYEEDYQKRTDADGNVKKYARLGPLLREDNAKVQQYIAYMANGGKPEDFPAYAEEQKKAKQSSGPAYS